MHTPPSMHAPNHHSVVELELSLHLWSTDFVPKWGVRWRRCGDSGSAVASCCKFPEIRQQAARAPIRGRFQIESELWFTRTAETRRRLVPPGKVSWRSHVLMVLLRCPQSHAQCCRCRTQFVDDIFLALRVKSRGLWRSADFPYLGVC